MSFCRRQQKLQDVVQRLKELDGNDEGFGLPTPDLLRELPAAELHSGTNIAKTFCHN